MATQAGVEGHGGSGAREEARGCRASGVRVGGSGAAAGGSVKWGQMMEAVESKRVGDDGEIEMQTLTKIK